MIAPDRRPAGPSADDQLRTAVLGRIVPLQHAQLAQVASAAGRLARLRRSLTDAPGADPAVWADTLGTLPGELLGRGDEPSSYEQAAHATMCLYALHQQSQSTGMHSPGRRLGTAVQALRQRLGEGDEGGPVLRRFHILATAGSFAETRHHLRGLVTMLRGEQVGLDYGQLAVDLRRLQSGRTAGQVRLAWGRDLYRRPPRHREQAEPDAGSVQADDVPTADHDLGVHV
jgi:CRISPR system Cascade subunit CasB